MGSTGLPKPTQEMELEIRCIGCGSLVTPSTIDWLLFHTSGLHVHNSARCHEKAVAKLYGKRGGE